MSFMGMQSVKCKLADEKKPYDRSRNPIIEIEITGDNDTFWSDIIVRKGRNFTFYTPQGGILISLTKDKRVLVHRERGGMPIETFRFGESKTVLGCKITHKTR
ncbi:hypothetical protein [Shimazuella alba]|uniref:Uncharacterized protein n=1 Tax=Shimazuella alba TaxID=2690964 RepID=A0A6I4VRK1_9BACL|nr:hypothetical protein [Shimazuella alba]MXQ52410.1 hypothetical protein [Shimazuella alba]